MLLDMQVRRGITRTVLLVGRWAAKFPSLRTHDAGLRGLLWSLARGVLANQSEAEWSGYEAWRHSGYAPVRWSLFGGVINVYPRCVPVVGELTEEDYASTGIIGPMDSKPDNVGLLNGRLVWLDYDQNWNDVPPCMHLRRAEFEECEE